MPRIHSKHALFAILTLCLVAEPAFAQRGGAPGGRGSGGGGGGFRGGGGGNPGGGGGVRGGGGARPGGGNPGGGQPRVNAPRAGGSSPTFSRPAAPRNNTPRPGVGDGPRTTNRVPLGDAGRNISPGGGNQIRDRAVDRSGTNRPGVDRKDIGRGTNRPGVDRSDLTRRADPGRTDRAVNRPNLPPNNAGRFNPNRNAGGNRNFDQNRGGRNANNAMVNNNFYRSPYQHNNWNVGYWNPGWNFGNNWGGVGYGYGPGWGYGPGYGYYGRNWGLWAGLGLAAWGLGSNYYNLGYGYYGNPYYATSYGGYDYAQPIPVVYYDESLGSASAVATRNSTAAQEADELIAAARLEFRNGNYEQALNQVDQAIQKTPDDAVLHEFRALTLFALKKFPEASAAIYAVLAVAPGWNWSTMSSMYPSVGLYTDQLRALEEEARANPDVAATHFLLGYHYLTMGHAAAARKQLETASKLSPEDQVSRQLLGVLSRADTQPEDGDRADSLPPATPPRDDSEALAPTPKIIGEWKAEAQGSDSIALNLSDDGTFQWTLNRDGKPVKHTGKYELEGDHLILDFEDGGGMVGQVTEKDGGFQFKLLNGPESDPGLNFRQG